MVKNKPPISGLIILLVLTLVLGGFFTQTAAAQDKITVGVTGPFTGPNARVGNEIWHSYQMAFNEIDNKIGDVEVELVKVDSESQPEKATRNYTQAVTRKGVDVTTFNWHSSVSVALMDMAAKYEIPHFFGGAATQMILDKYHEESEKYQYYDSGKFWPTPRKLSIAYVTTLTEAMEAGEWDPETKKVAIYGENTDWGRSFGDSIAEQFEEAGWEVVSKDYFKMQKTKFYPLIQKWQDREVSVIAGTSTVPASFAAMVKQAREVGLKSLVIADGLGWMGEWYDLAGDASDYVLDQIPQWASEEAKQFRDRFEEQWGVEPSASSSGLAYDGANYLIKILRKTYQLYGELNSENIQKVNHNLVRTGDLTYTEGILMKEYKYTPDTVPDPKVAKDFYIYPVIQYHGGEGTVIWPQDWAEGEFEIPPYMEE